MPIFKFSKFDFRRNLPLYCSVYIKNLKIWRKYFRNLRYETFSAIVLSIFLTANQISKWKLNPKNLNTFFIKPLGNKSTMYSSIIFYLIFYVVTTGFFFQWFTREISLESAFWGKTIINLYFVYQSISHCKINSIFYFIVSITFIWNLSLDSSRRHLSPN